MKSCTTKLVKRQATDSVAYLILLFAYDGKDIKEDECQTLLVPPGHKAKQCSRFGGWCIHLEGS